jgi:hypothetical protein
MSEAHARRDDPWTSHEAAGSIPSEEIHRSQEAVLDCFTLTGPMYDRKLQREYDRYRVPNLWPEQSESGIRTRRKELVDRGRLKDSGRSVRRPSGRKSIVWELAR